MGSTSPKENDSTLRPNTVPLKRLEKVSPSNSPREIGLLSKIPASSKLSFASIRRRLCYTTWKVNKLKRFKQFSCTMLDRPQLLRPTIIPNFNNSGSYCPKSLNLSFWKAKKNEEVLFHLPVTHK